ncbi:winged helix-turn-helix transcriptional regulator [Rhodococcus sp. BP-252]|nr:MULTISPECIES: metalloregulator ArsR/SmtB family transcription factor [Rhodococcus]MBY6412396.1 winged helix-turn-helix transcriptional regulator [Rhodococcus sp. BP-320]MBY6416976.1 winged helix-turn-helix transcriptional regulator [Rhodococcus sp. BP-321]MBY6422061.1 winged helix-turn-helix transcriptional regulator [Rhodococcus sp. BP-324]MBY6427000.1 winged helix-turn-helix transcriptional regulator [Rhodococcus sp. BP-323]MBY6432329.1 winged helix-turn-helix transcriptional regulator [R
MTESVPTRSPSLDHGTNPDRVRLESASDIFRMLADPTRLHLLWILSHDPSDVSTLTEATGASRTAVSQHLAKLRFTGMVETTRDGRRVVYRIVDGHLARLVREGFNYADHRVTGEPPHR